MRNTLKTKSRSGQGFFTGILQESRSFGQSFHALEQTEIASEGAASQSSDETVGVAVRHHMAPNMIPMKSALRNQLQTLRSQSAATTPIGPFSHRPGGVKMAAMKVFGDPEAEN